MNQNEEEMDRVRRANDDNDILGTNFVYDVSNIIFSIMMIKMLDGKLSFFLEIQVVKE